MTYKVKAGDNLSKVAKRYGISLAQLLKANPQIKNPDRIKVGQLINLPDTSIATSTETTQPLPSKVVPAIDPTPKTKTTTDTPASPVAAAAGALGEALAEVLGALSAKYETGGRGPGTVSTGAGDRGGVSYGSYQMASKLGVATRFVKQENFPWLTDFQNLKAGTSEFTACWKRIAKNETDAFQNAQHDFIKKTHYDLLVAKIISDDGLDVNSRCHALKDVVWSTAVQHGGATTIVHKALAKVKCEKNDPSFDELVIRAIYAERGKTKPDGSLAYFSRNSANVQKGVANRFKSELKDALAMLAKDVK
ncbi:MAG TPA: LysM domain-containing protein [Pyrinomonadaceae bacterium]|nr:LysM domain-containing protein [Pyrinomonadaceae bacterium]